ncbi:copper chaperone [Paraburkholderia fungorum]|nr:copper chaperone [Paraburkholderia fungorum]MDT8843305.1 copper chaperone [Paraburkholderia fungorum]
MKDDSDVAILTCAMHTVDPDAKVNVHVNTRTVEIDSWLFAEEFLVAFAEAGYDVKLAER